MQFGLCGRRGGNTAHIGSGRVLVGDGALLLHHWQHSVVMSVNFKVVLHTVRARNGLRNVAVGTRVVVGTNPTTDASPIRGEGGVADITDVGKFRHCARRETVLAGKMALGNS